MVSFLAHLNPVVQALLATIFTWGMTAIGAAAIFLTRTVNRKLLDAMLGFAAGIMIAASFWSLLEPAISLSSELGGLKWVPALVGFLVGAGFLFLLDKVLPHLHLDMPMSKAEGIHTRWRRSVLLIMAITIHNLPEGIAVGVAFGAAGVGMGNMTITAALGLALGIGLQNLPEGLAVSAPLRAGGMGAGRSFFFGQLSAIVEPIGGVIGAAAVFYVRPLLPYALSFAAGAMMFVVIEDLIPESQHDEGSDPSTLGAIIGFALMMLLDVAFS
jgi:ZIP family zinc transporter